MITRIFKSMIASFINKFIKLFGNNKIFSVLTCISLRLDLPNSALLIKNNNALKGDHTSLKLWHNCPTCCVLFCWIPANLSPRLQRGVCASNNSNCLKPPLVHTSELSSLSAPCTSVASCLEFKYPAQNTQPKFVPNKLNSSEIIFNIKQVKRLCCLEN